MRLARINTLLLVAIIGINAYIIGAPMMPAITFWTGAHVSGQPARIQTALHPAAGQPAVIPTDNRLLIPGMQLAAAHQTKAATPLSPPIVLLIRSPRVLFTIWTLSRSATKSVFSGKANNICTRCRKLKRCRQPTPASKPPPRTPA